LTVIGDSPSGTFSLIVNELTTKAVSIEYGPVLYRAAGALSIIVTDIASPRHNSDTVRKIATTIRLGLYGEGRVL
jgi:hypothetical protein